jgi:RHS repeat-associated protein
VTDAATNQTQYAYDRGSPATRAVRVAGVVDTESNLTGITDAKNRLTSFAYDIKGRLTQTTFPSTLSESYTYDAIDNLASKTDRKSQTINYVYDALNRLTHKGYPDSTGVDYIYDLVGKIKQVTDPTGIYGFAYDNMGRLIGTTTQYTFIPGRTFTLNYTYDKSSNRTSLTDAENSTTTYTYDVLNRLQTLSDWQSNQFGFAYDDLSRRTSLIRPNGVNTSYSYDNLSRLQSILHQRIGITLDGASYTYDNAGNRVAKTNYLDNSRSTYTYDSIYQLTHVDEATGGSSTAVEDYTYDAVGNRLSSLDISQYSYDSSNHLTSSSDGVTYTYDQNGNIRTKTDGSGITTYNWDFENHLRQVVLPGADGSITFNYDPLGRRIEKISSAEGIRAYLYDQKNIIEELDSTGSPFGRITQSLAIDEPLFSVKSGNMRFYHGDGLGSITMLSDDLGAGQSSYKYDSFGKIRTMGNPSNQFLYTAREWDNDIHQMYYRARYYDPNIGRFDSEDRLGFGAGVNFYSYVKNSPMNFVDPTGFKCTQVSPWTEIPSMNAPPKPIDSSPAGLDWHFTGWSAITTPGMVDGEAHAGGVGCYCTWAADHTRIRLLYRVSIAERAKFECDPCKKIEYRTRVRQQVVEQLVEGMPIMPESYRTTWGVIIQLGNYADDPDEGDSMCSCMLSPP